MVLLLHPLPTKISFETFNIDNFILIKNQTMLKYTALFLLFIFTGCSNYGQLTLVTKLPKTLKENSGIVSLNNNTFWIIEDSGNPDEIYNVDQKGNLLKKFKVKNAKNKDWEDLTKDELGNVYIGDFGNNNSQRKDLIIYKIPNPENEPGDKIDAEQIHFSYPEQTDLSPKKEGFLYDAEAFFYQKGFLYIITRNRTNPFNGKTFIYKVPAKKGTYDATLVGEFKTGDDYRSCQITSADISPDGKKIVLLSYGKIWLYTDFQFDDFSKGKLQLIDLKGTTQLESICFIDNNTLFLSDEEKGPTGRNLYSYSLGSLRSRRRF